MCPAIAVSNAVDITGTARGSARSAVLSVHPGYASYTYRFAVASPPRRSGAGVPACLQWREGSNGQTALQLIVFIVCCALSRATQIENGTVWSTFVGRL